MPLAHALADLLRSAGQQVAVLEAKEPRRAGLTAEVLARNGMLVLVTCTPDHPQDCDTARKRHGKSGTQFLDIRVAPPPSDTPKADLPPHAPDFVVPADTPETERPALLLELLTERRFLVRRPLENHSQPSVPREPRRTPRSWT
ncbi:hypothetical protein [Streptomyces sp. MMG1533]|uniref:hypothetical protein n=1 Tax=Streptomyces sp. MMG1533 TaxID=1415546 RepID=UPI0006AEDB6E|nr:hypothetical protein [Streptomyces sp. MMG1533]